MLVSNFSLPSNVSAQTRVSLYGVIKPGETLESNAKEHIHMFNVHEVNGPGVVPCRYKWFDTTSAFQKPCSLCALTEACPTSATMETYMEGEVSGALITIDEAPGLAASRISYGIRKPVNTTYCPQKTFFSAWQRYCQKLPRTSLAEVNGSVNHSLVSTTGGPLIMPEEITDADTQTLIRAVRAYQDEKMTEMSITELNKAFPKIADIDGKLTAEFVDSYVMRNIDDHGLVFFSVLL